MSSSERVKYWTAGFQDDPDGVDSGAIHDSRPLVEPARREKKGKNELGNQDTMAILAESVGSQTRSRSTQHTQGAALLSRSTQQSAP